MNIKLSKHNPTIFVGIFFIGLLGNSCKKDFPIIKTPLTGDTVIFVGTWNWIYSEHNYNWCDPPIASEVITPDLVNINFKIEISKCGHLSLYRKDSLISIYNLSLVQYFSFDNVQLSNATKFGFILDGHENLQFNGLINTDTIITTTLPGFIFKDEPGCEVYQNYFAKE